MSYFSKRKAPPDVIAPKSTGISKVTHLKNGCVEFVTRDTVVDPQTAEPRGRVLNILISGRHRSTRGASVSGAQPERGTPGISTLRRESSSRSSTPPAVHKKGHRRVISAGSPTTIASSSPPSSPPLEPAHQSEEGKHGKRRRRSSVLRLPKRTMSSSHSTGDISTLAAETPDSDGDQADGEESGGSSFSISAAHFLHAASFRKKSKKKDGSPPFSQTKVTALPAIVSELRKQSGARPHSLAASGSLLKGKLGMTASMSFNDLAALAEVAEHEMAGKGLSGGPAALDSRDDFVFFGSTGERRRKRAHSSASGDVDRPWAAPTLNVEGMPMRPDVGRPYTIYLVQFSYPDRGWMVFRRYSEFLSLHKELGKLFRLDGPAFPPKRIIGAMRPAFIEKRREKLQDYMRYLLSRSDVARSQLLRDFCDWHDPLAIPELCEPAQTEAALPGSRTKFAPSTPMGAIRREASSSSESSFAPVIPKEKQLDISDFEILSRIGKGGAGEVFLCRKRGTGERMLHKNVVAHSVQTERDVLVVCTQSEWITQLYYAFQDERHLYLCMEWVCGGDLRSLLGTFGALDEASAKFYLAEMVVATKALHGIGYIHRDLKPENFLIDKSGHIKLTDFGLSKGAVEGRVHATEAGWEIPVLKPVSESDDDEDDVKGSGVTTSVGLLSESGESRNATRSSRRRKLAYSVVGSPLYMAPEILTGQGYGPSVDWWSMGCILYEMLADFPPFAARTPSQCFRNVLDFQNTLCYPTMKIAEMRGTAWEPGADAPKSLMLGGTFNPVQQHPSSGSMPSIDGSAERSRMAGGSDHGASEAPLPARGLKTRRSRVRPVPVLPSAPALELVDESAEVGLEDEADQNQGEAAAMLGGAVSSAHERQSPIALSDYRSSPPPFSLEDRSISSPGSASSPSGRNPAPLHLSGPWTPPDSSLSPDDSELSTSASDATPMNSPTLDSMRAGSQYYVPPEVIEDGPISSVAWDLVSRLLCAREERFTYRQIRRHPFFADVDWDKLRCREPPFVPKLESETDTFYFEHHEVALDDEECSDGSGPPDSLAENNELCEGGVEDGEQIDAEEAQLELDFAKFSFNRASATSMPSSASGASSGADL